MSGASQRSPRGHRPPTESGSSLPAAPEAGRSVRKGTSVGSARLTRLGTTHPARLRPLPPRSRTWHPGQTLPHMEDSNNAEPPSPPSPPAPASPPGGPTGGGALHLRELHEGMHGLTPAFGEMLAEVAAVCLEDQLHASGVSMRVTGTHSLSLALVWDPTTDQQRRNWVDKQDATEFGACGCAILVARRLTGLQVTQQSYKTTGFDWWIGDESTGPGLFQDKARLEVSGIRRGDESDVKRRMTLKKKQTTQSDATTSLPAWAVVVEFGEPQTRAVQR